MGDAAGSLLPTGAKGNRRVERTLLLTAFPHLVLDGAILAAAAIDAAEIILAVDRSTPAARAGVAEAIEARRAAQWEEVSIRIVEVPSRYVAGEESALVHFLNDGDAKPTIVPPRPYERGVRGRPTLVQNVETLANVALIARNGADWFRLVGTTEEPGTALVTIGGAVDRPGVYEIALGTPVSGVVTAAGGLTDDISAFLIGGYFGSWIPVTTGWDTRLTHNDLRAARSTFGCGVIYAFPASACGIAETARVARYLAEETAGQCGSCVNGLASIASSLDSIVAGKNLQFESGRIARWMRQIEGRGACHLPDGAIRFVATALDVFSTHLERHNVRGRCKHLRHPPVLPLPAAESREWNWR